MQAASPESEAKIAAMFDRIAPGYDFLNRLLSMGQDRQWRRAMVSELPHQGDLRLLDIATGTGDVILAAAPNYQRAQFLGIDISAEMLRLADSKFHAYQSSHPSKSVFQTQQMSMEKLNFADESFNAVTVSFGLRNVVQKELGISEAFRVLKQGGRFLILEFFMPRSGWLGKLFQWYFRHILPRIGGLFSDRQAYSYLPASVMGFYDPKRMQEVLMAAGFKRPVSRSFLFGAVHLVIAEK
jgi:demethylmenaquinone methyltransferase/2-methoxy-6-polyprenyl-1,4-benzoquinol methylase